MSYPPIEPYLTGRLKVSEIHELYYEISGNLEGIPVVFLHGGPGGGTRPSDRCYFNPEKYKIVLFDQRASGRSTVAEGHSPLEGNTTWELVEDVEKLRVELGVQRWGVFGGSWGSTLALLYAQAYPERVKFIIVRGIFLFRQSELAWFYQPGGTSNIFPEAWDEFLSAVPEDERHGDLLQAYHRMLTSGDEGVVKKAARAWTKWEMATSRLYQDPEVLALASDEEFADFFAKIENHFFVNKGFMKEGQILFPENIAKIKDIPTIIVNGRYDVICPPRAAYDLKALLPNAELHFVPDAGHSGREPGTVKALVEAADKFADL